MSTAIAGRIQHTLYDVGTNAAAVRRHCGECVEYGFAAAMVPARYVGLAVELLSGTSVDVATAVDFPIGLMSERGRVAEAIIAAEAGADQIDIGVPIGLLADKEDELFAASISSIVQAVSPIAIKVMLELPLLTSEQAERAVRLAVDAGALWLKNASSGVVGVATPEDISFLRSRAPESVRVKASGGIHTAEQVQRLLNAGADLVGTSSGVAIVTGTRAEGVTY